MRKSGRFIIFTVFVFIVGGVGGLFVERGLAWVAGLPAFSRSAFLQNIGRGVTVVKPVEQLIIRDGKDTNNLVRKAQEALGKALLRETPEGRIIGETNGVFVTADGGFIAYAPEVIDRGAVSVVRNGNTLGAQLLHIDSAASLALLRAEASGFPQVAFRSEDLALGEELFWLWRGADERAWHLLRTYVTANQREVAEATIFAHIPTRAPESQGTALFDRDAKLVGILGFRTDGTTQFISAQTIQQFLNQ